MEGRVPGSEQSAGAFLLDNGEGLFGIIVPIEVYTDSEASLLRVAQLNHVTARATRKRTRTAVEVDVTDSRKPGEEGSEVIRPRFREDLNGAGLPIAKNPIGERLPV